MMQRALLSMVLGGALLPAVAIATPKSKASIVKLGTDNHEIQALAAQRGWTRDRGTKLGILSADLIYTTDHWKTARTAETRVINNAGLQTLFNHETGFLLQLPVGTEIEYAVHARVGATSNNRPYYYDTADVWLNNGGFGVNYCTRTAPPVDK